MIKKDEVRLCYDFAYVAWDKESQSKKNFGDKPREKSEFLADQITGKIAELIFKKEIEEKFPAIQVRLDFMHYMNPHHTDNGDVEILKNGQLIDSRLDIKSSSYRAQWLIVEDYKFWIPNTTQPASDKYVMVKFNESMLTNPELRKNPERILQLEGISGEIKGWELHSSFISSADNEPWFIYNKGQQLLNPRLLPSNPASLNDKLHLQNYINKVARTNENIVSCIGPTLKAKLNYGLPIKWLQTDLDELFA